MVNCKSCSEEGVCSECRSGFWLQSDDCCVECDSGNRQYLDGSIKKCSSCTVPDCLYCQNAESTCDRCNYPYFLKGTSCDTCVDSQEIQLTTAVSGDTCQTCVEYCTECTSTSICKKCDGEAYVPYSHKDYCQLCNGGDGGNRIFNNYCLLGSDCVPNCSMCLDGYKCQTCSDGFYLSQSEKMCLPCPSSCWRCSSFKVCTKCNPGNFKLGSICTPCGVNGGDEGQKNAGKSYQQY